MIFRICLVGRRAALELQLLWLKAMFSMSQNRLGHSCSQGFLCSILMSEWSSITSPHWKHTLSPRRLTQSNSTRLRNRLYAVLGLMPNCSAFAAKQKLLVRFRSLHRLLQNLCSFDLGANSLLHSAQGVTAPATPAIRMHFPLAAPHITIHEWP